MTDRRSYTVDEIDRMRVALSRIETGAWGGGGIWNEDDFRRERRREDRLRTYMLGGVDPEELENKATEALAAARIARDRDLRTTDVSTIMGHPCVMAYDRSQTASGGSGVADDLIERVARALMVFDGDDPDRETTIAERPVGWMLMTEYAEAAIAAHKAALAEAGFVILPREATNAMLTSGAAEIGGPEDHLRAMSCWRAMVKAYEREGV